MTFTDWSKEETGRGTVLDLQNNVESPKTKNFAVPSNGAKSKFSENKIVGEDLKIIAEKISDVSPKLEGKTVLVTGGAGFLGKYIVLTLDYLNKNVFDEPCRIIILDNFISGLPDVIHENENLKLIKHDITQNLELDEDIDYIMHAACMAAPMFYNKYRLETIDGGFTGTKNMLELARKKHVRSFLYFSSSEIYGDPFPEFIPTKESYRGNVSCVGPRACYDEPKRIGETLCTNYANIFGIPVKIVRPFNIYGPGLRLDDNRVIVNLVVKALRGEKVPVYGDGMKSRTFCYISDATIGWFKALLSDHNNECFNIGYPEQEIKMKHLAEMVIALVENEKAEIQMIDDKSGIYGGESDPNRRCPDITKAKAMLGYEPRINLITGIKRFIGWARGEVEGENALKDGR